MSSRLYNTYVSLKIKSPYKKYLFKSGIFYIFIDDDAKELHKLLNLKLSNLNSEIVKCGFPAKSLDKYIKTLKQYGYEIEIVDLYTNSLFNYEEYLFKTKIHKFINKISHLDVDSLSISQTYDILDELKQEANNLLKGITDEKKNNLYENIYKMENIQEAFNEVCRNTKNKRKVANYKQYKCIYISRIYNLLKNKSYKVGPYNVFTIYEPKERRIVSQNIQDKIINHLVSRQILYPTLIPCLISENVASIKDRGTKEGLRLSRLYHQKCKIKYKTYYILKCDISKFFASIDKEILKNKLQKKIKDKDALNIVYKIIDSEEHGLGIGNMTSQVLAVFYLNDLDHYIKEDLKIKYYVRYQDDFLLFHESKAYLKKCFLLIQKFLEKEHLILNRKSRLYKNTNHFIFLGRNNKGKYAKYRTANRKLKYKKYLYESGKISFNSYLFSHISYKSFEKRMPKKHP